MATIIRQILRQSLSVTQMQRTTPQMLRLYSSSKASDTNSSSTAASTDKPLTIDKEALKQLVKTSKVVIFMKGNPEAPKCGFSNAVVQILRMHGVQYDAHDVLLSDELRQGIKELTEWPTIPQVFLNGEFVGGCDILLQMHQNGDLVEELKKIGIESLLLKNPPSASSAAPKDAQNK